MIYAIDSVVTKMKSIPHKKEYRIWMDKLSADEIAAMRSAIERYVEGKQVFTSSHIPGNDWAGTVFMPICEKACGFNEEMAACCFGLLVWEVLMESDKQWAFRKSCEIRGIECKGMTYWRIDVPPEAQEAKLR